MSKKILVTTSLEETWSEHDSILFLGEWCRLYNRKKQWSQINATVLPYHWDDRTKLFKDYNYLNNLYEKILAQCAFELNKIHNTQHDTRYWRIIIGPWLGPFIQVLFDRWESIQQALSYDVSKTFFLEYDDHEITPKDTGHFFEFYINDHWNHYIYTQILKHIDKIPLVKKTFKPQPFFSTKKKSIKQKIKASFANCYSYLISFLAKKDSIYIYGVSLPLIDQLLLALKLKQPPQIWRWQTPKNATLNQDKRQWNININTECDFENFLIKIIPQQIPIIFLEGYEKLTQQIKQLHWPKKPKIIWTDNAYNTDEVFKAWTAYQIKQGALFIVGQHGGNYGTNLWSSTEDHENKISDYYFSWGWTDSRYPNIKPIGQLLSKYPLGVDHSKQSDILLVTAICPRQSVFMYSFIVAGQWLNYFQDQCRFVDALDSNIRSHLLVRLHHNDYEWNQRERWHDHFGNIRIDQGNIPIKNLLKKTKLYISTYNATTFLESLSMNIPTIIYWDPSYWELRDSAIPYFEDLKRVGIFHETPEAAAHQINKIWNKLDEWWNEKNLQDILQNFKKQYSYLPENIVQKITDTLLEISK